MLKVILVVAIVLVVLVVWASALIGFSAVVTDKLNNKTCTQWQELNKSLEFHYDFWTGCTVKLPSGEYVDAAQYMQYQRLNIDP